MDGDVIAVLKKVGAILTDDHIVGTSGRHMSVYINPDQLLPHTNEMSVIGKLFAERFKDMDIDVVVGPAIGGILLSQWVAYYLSQFKKKEILGLFTEKDGDKNQVFDRGFEKLVNGKKVLVVEDITTTGGSVKKAADSVRKAGGNVVALSVIINRDSKKVNSETIGYNFIPLAVLEASSYTEEECPLCKTNVPVNPNIGHGKEFMEQKKK